MPPFNVSRDRSGDAWFRLGKLDVTSTVLVVLIGAVGVVASAFANRSLHLVLANYGRAAVTVETTADHAPADDPAAPAGRAWTLPPRSLKILRRAEKPA